MLKIKDNVDLKELEKYGFIEGFYAFYRLNNCYLLSWNEFMISKDIRIIYERFEPCGHWCLVSEKDSKYIKDLVNNGFVEDV